MNVTLNYSARIRRPQRTYPTCKHTTLSQWRALRYVTLLVLVLVHGLRYNIVLRYPSTAAAAAVFTYAAPAVQLRCLRIRIRIRVYLSVCVCVCVYALCVRNWRPFVCRPRFHIHTHTHSDSGSGSGSNPCWMLQFCQRRAKRV